MTDDSMFKVSGDRAALDPRIAAHLDGLAATTGRLSASRLASARALADWLGERLRAGIAPRLIVICTGNSRRSVLGATMGNLAAAYVGRPEIRFFSAGSAPTAVNSRTVTCLRSIGVAFEPTGAEAPRGEPGTANPIFRTRWGADADERFEGVEFSKRFDDRSLPREDFAALMVCTEADQGCPLVPGASLRLSIPHDDPKDFDDGPFESEKYAERRDELGRLLLAALSGA